MSEVKMLEEEQSQSEDPNQSGFTEICDNIIERIGQDRRGTLDQFEQDDVENQNIRELQ